MENPNGIPSISPGLGRGADLPWVRGVHVVKPHRGFVMPWRGAAPRFGWAQPRWGW